MILEYNGDFQKVSILENAYRISYEKTFNQIWLASFSLPLNNPKNKYCSPLAFVEIIDDYIDEEGNEVNDYIGLFRITPKTTIKKETNNELTLVLEHVLATQLDKQIFGYIQTINKPTRYNLELLLSQQNTRHWVLGQVDISRSFYDFENSNLLSAIFSIAKPFDVEMKWIWDTTSYPWTLNLVQLETDPSCVLQEGDSLVGLQVEENPMDISNRIYQLGYGEDVNQLTIAKVKNGVKYIQDNDSIN